MDFFDAIRQEADRVLADPKEKRSEYLDKFVQFPEEGAITVRILPPSHGLVLPFQATRLHKLNGKSYHCRKDLAGGKWTGKIGVCPPCDHYNDLWNRANNKANAAKAASFIDTARKIKPIERYYYNCVVRDDPSQKGTKILSVGKTIHAGILQAYVGNKKISALKALGKIHDVTGKEGRDLMIVKKLKKGAEKFPEYELHWLDPTPLGNPDEVKEWLAQCYNLADLRIIKTADELKLELKRELGLVPNEDTGYDPKEFEPDYTAPVRQTVEASTRPAPAVSQPTATVAEVEEPPFDTEDLMADTDFIDELNQDDE